jgi:hypothetical protein
MHAEKGAQEAPETAIYCDCRQFDRTMVKASLSMLLSQASKIPGEA